MVSEVFVHGRWPLHHFSFDVAGTLSTGEPAVCEALLSSLVRHGLEPETLDIEEDPRRPFVLADAVRSARGKMPQADVFLRRRTYPAYDSFWCRASMPMVTFAFAPARYPTFASTVANLADEVAAVCRPDFASLVPYAKLRPGATPLTGDDSVKSLLDRGGVLPSSYALEGVGGLGYRTYLGPVVVAQLGEERLESLPSPIKVAKLPWGGWRIDLADDPWSADWSVIRESYQAAMRLLAPANWFAPPVLDARGFWRFTRPTTATWSPNPLW